MGNQIGPMFIDFRTPIFYPCAFFWLKYKLNLYGKDRKAPIIALRILRARLSESNESKCFCKPRQLLPSFSALATTCSTFWNFIIACTTYGISSIECRCATCNTHKTGTTGDMCATAPNESKRAANVTQNNLLGILCKCWAWEAQSTLLPASRVTMWCFYQIL